MYRQGIHLLLVHSWTIVTVFLGSDYSELKCYKPSNHMLWLISFSCEAMARGDKVRLRRQIRLDNKRVNIKFEAFLCVDLFLFFFLIDFSGAI